MAKPTHQAATRRAIEEFFGRKVPEKLTYAQLRQKMDEVAAIAPERKIDTMTAMVLLEIRPGAFAALKAIDPPKHPFRVEGSFGREGKPAARASFIEIQAWMDALVHAGHIDPDKQLPWDAPERVVHGEVDFMTVHEGRSTKIIGALVSHDALVDLVFRDPTARIQSMTLAQALDHRWVDEQDREAWARAYAAWCEIEAARLKTLSADMRSIADRVVLDRNTAP